MAPAVRQKEIARQMAQMVGRMVASDKSFGETLSMVLAVGAMEGYQAADASHTVERCSI
jgi:hypothetical protein